VCQTKALDDIGDKSRTFKNPDGSGEVVDTAGSPQGGGEDLDGGNEIISEAVVEVTLELEDILNTVEFLLESVQCRVSVTLFQN
jgi:hypothetical protein